MTTEAGEYQQPRPCVCGKSHVDRETYWKHRLEAEELQENGEEPVGASRPITVEIVGTAPRTYSRWYWFKWRIAGRFHPEAVTAEWYRQDCPPALDTSFLTFRERVGWAIDKWLRECRRSQAA